MTASSEHTVPCEERLVRTECSSLPPPSMHMHLGRGLSSLARRCQFSWFETNEQDTVSDAETSNAMSESDLLSLFEIPLCNNNGISSSRCENKRSTEKLLESNRECPQKRSLDAS
mmetsp:Transcript_2031/g.4153  ORF Transcript_2031/g.4153 Transcript_2031/m.4153 type:complete len:115 (-) Transcript_2031:406-750(-)